VDTQICQEKDVLMRRIKFIKEDLHAKIKHRCHLEMQNSKLKHDIKGKKGRVNVQSCQAKGVLKRNIKFTKASLHAKIKYSSRLET